MERASLSQRVGIRSKLNTKFIATHHLDWNTLKACKFVFFLFIFHGNLLGVDAEVRQVKTSEGINRDC